jgi:hypothetical protein
LKYFYINYAKEIERKYNSDTFIFDIKTKIKNNNIIFRINKLTYYIGGNSKTLDFNYENTYEYLINLHDEIGHIQIKTLNNNKYILNDIDYLENVHIKINIIKDGGVYYFVKYFAK